MGNSNKNKVKNFLSINNRLLGIMVFNSIRNYRLYFYCFALPFIFFMLILFLKTNFIFTSMINIDILVYIFIAPIFCIFYYSHILYEWRNSIFLRQMSNFGIKKLNFIVSYFIFSIILTLISSLFMLLCITIIFKYLNNQVFYSAFSGGLNGYQLFGIFFSIIISAIVWGSVSLLISGFFSNHYIIQSLSVLFIFLNLIFGNIIISPSAESKNYGLIITSYFFPQKAITWIMYQFVCKVYDNFYFSYYIILNLDAYLTFDEIYEPILLSFAYVIIFSVSGIYLFKISAKK